MKNCVMRFAYCAELTYLFLKPHDACSTHIGGKSRVLFFIPTGVLKFQPAIGSIIDAFAIKWGSLP